MQEASVKCPTCGADLPVGATFCPKCGFVVGSSTAAAAPQPPELTPVEPPKVVYVSPPVIESRDSSSAAWVAVVVLVLLLGVGLALWSAGYLGSASSSAQPGPTSVTIENSPQVSSETPVDAGSNTDPAPAPMPAPVPPVPAPPASPPVRTPAIDIVSVKGQALETNAVQWRYGYTLRLRNNTDSDIKADFRIQFLDEQGFPVDDDLLSDVVIPANSEMSFDGDDMVKTSLAERIRTVRAEMR